MAVKPLPLLVPSVPPFPPGGDDAEVLVTTTVVALAVYVLNLAGEVRRSMIDCCFPPVDCMLLQCRDTTVLTKYCGIESPPRFFCPFFFRLFFYEAAAISVV